MIRPSSACLGCTIVGREDWCRGLLRWVGLLLGWVEGWWSVEVWIGACNAVVGGGEQETWGGARLGGRGGIGQRVVTDRAARIAPDGKGNGDEGHSVCGSYGGKERPLMAAGAGFLSYGSGRGVGCGSVGRDSRGTDDDDGGVGGCEGGGERITNTVDRDARGESNSREGGEAGRRMLGYPSSAVAFLVLCVAAGRGLSVAVGMKSSYAPLLLQTWFADEEVKPLKKQTKP
ncbi:hypothetical protein Tco_1485790 [Tanacetum coccineum]